MSNPIRTIGLEEHAWPAELRDALIANGSDASVVFNQGPMGEKLLDTADRRLAAMDEAGLDVQVLSITTPGTQALDAAEAVPLARHANDFLAAAVAAHPDRFAFFATLPTPNPEAAADELRRAVNEQGAVGALIFPRTQDRYLDHESFRVIFEAAAELDVPLYLHPQIPLKAVRDACFTGFGDVLDIAFATGGWGWHAEAGIAAFRLILSGTFDRHPDLQLILGHWGELLVPFVERTNILTPWTGYLERPVADYITGNMHVTGAGIFSHRMLTDAIATLGADRVLFSTDYPFQFAPDGGARAFLETAPIGPEDKQKIGHLNAERLLKLG